MQEIVSMTLNPKEDRRLLRGHLWAYRNEFRQLTEAEDGALVDVFSAERRFVGRGFYQAEGGIAVRLLTRHQEEIDAAFFRHVVDVARAFRERLFPEETTWRWVYGESDGLPGLVADRYGSLVCIKTSCRFYALRRDELAAVFLAQAGVTGVLFSGCGEPKTYGEVPENGLAKLNGIELAFPVHDAQKTGLFLDQRTNLQVLTPLARDASVLDGHCYVGAWSCIAGRAGAKSVLGVDTSLTAIEAARANAQQNGLDTVCQFEAAPVEDFLEREALYDAVVLDPPAFAKARNQAAKALPRYQALNAAAMRSVKPGGYLITSSCSHFVDAPDFTEMLKRAAAAARRQVWLIELRGASPDHPTLLAMPETAYLKCAVLRVL